MAEPETERGESVEKPAPPAKKPRAKRASGSRQSTAKNGGNGKSPSAPAGAHAGHGWIWVALVTIAILSGGAIATVWLVEAATQQADLERVEAKLRADMAGAIAATTDERMTEFRAQLADIEERIAKIPDRATAKETEAAMALLAEKIDGLAERIGDLEKRPQAAQADGASDEAVAAAAADAKRNADKLAALAERLARLETAQEAQAPETERKQSLVVAVGQLREALNDSKPFTSELESVTALGAAEVGAMTADIAPYADTGIATVAELRKRFGAVAKEITAADAAPKDGDWMDKALSQASNVVSIRKVGPVEGGDPAAIVSRAEAHLAADNLQSAVDELGGLEGAPADAAKDWLAQARARLASQRVMRELHNHVIGQIAQTPEPAP